MTVSVRFRKALILSTIVFSCLFFFLSCSDNNNSVATESDTLTRFERLLAKYKLISFDTLKVYYDREQGVKGKYSGTPLANDEIDLLPDELPGRSNHEEFYACFKFPIDSSRIGLITRTPSTYESSSIKLLVYDQKADSILYHVELAEEWGDAGEKLSKRSWLYMSAGQPEVFTETVYTYDRSVANETDTIIDVNETFYILELGKIRADTNKNVSEDLRASFY
ncbi:MAG TPA: hypothetical protein VI731_03380 [Bacteroidia bacterium]|nr:hypothetical protein [Bacteroidia bacterium]